MGIDILTLAAARAGKGGGSASKYKKPDWGADTAIVDFLPETTFEASEDMGGMAPITNPLPYTLVGGNTYEVIYNGTRYSCVCFDEDNGAGGGALYLGNAAATGIEAPASDEPFVFASFYGSALDDMGVPGIAMPLDGSTSFTLSIKGESGEIHKIPNEYTDFAPLNVTATVDGTTIKLSVTYKEIIEAIEIGKSVYVNGSGHVYTLASVDNNNNEIMFTSFIYITNSLHIYYLKVYVDNTVKSGLLPVDINPND